MDIQREAVLHFAGERRALFSHPAYAIYVGRNARMLQFLEGVDRHIHCDSVPIGVGQEFKKALLDFRATPALDASTRGSELREMELVLHSHCADYFQSIAK